MLHNLMCACVALCVCCCILSAPCQSWCKQPKMSIYSRNWPDSIAVLKLNKALKKNHSVAKYLELSREAATMVQKNIYEGWVKQLPRNVYHCWLLASCKPSRDWSSRELFQRACLFHCIIFHSISHSMNFCMPTTRSGIVVKWLKHSTVDQKSQVRIPCTCLLCFVYLSTLGDQPLVERVSR